jgi:hypothetical protein
MNKDIESLFKSEIDKLPVYIRDMEVIKKELSSEEKLIRIDSHNTKKYRPFPFYKSISQCFEIGENETNNDGQK